VIIIFGFLFYWNAYRPSQIKKECFTIAKEKAVKLLKTKAEILDETGYMYKKEYEKMAEKGMYFKNDFDSYYKDCLKGKGL